MTKIDKVWRHLQKHGWIDAKKVQKITGTTSVRDYIYELNKTKRCITIPRHVTPTYTRWIRVSKSHDSNRR